MQPTHFDERAKSWDSDPKKVERAATVAVAIKNQLPLEHAMRALEYGCGTGLLSFALQEEFAGITLADTSQGMLDVLAQKIADSNCENMRPLRLDLTSEPLPTSRFNVIYTLMTLHHIPLVDDILQKFHHILLPNGFIAIADLDSEDGSFHGQDQHDVHRGFDRNALQKQVELAGFTQVSFTTVFTMTKMVAGAPKNFPIFLMTAKKTSQTQE